MQNVQSYTLPADKLVQAIEFAHARHVLHFGSFLISALVLVAIIRLRLVPRMRRVHPIGIIAAIVLLTAIGDLPAELYGHAISLKNHISIQGWPSWMWDWAKAQMVGTIVAIAVIAPFYLLLRKSPNRWWIYAWLASIPVMLFSAFADPLVFEPLFNDFKPLAAKHAELIDPIEKLLDRARVKIPRDHLFEMEASQKTNSLNAYVSGFGPSRRVVLYDTIIAKENGPPLLTTIGHELGHYVLNHISMGLAFGSVCLLLGLWMLFHLIPWFLAHWGGQLGISAISDWASLPVLLLVVLLAGFIAEPVGNAFSRYLEHQADVYSLEITHGILPDAGQAAAQSFQIEGETGLEVPNPNPFIVFWLYSHPPVAERLRFSLEYDPWKQGRRPEFVE